MKSIEQEIDIASQDPRGVSENGREVVSAQEAIERAHVADVHRIRNVDSVRIVRPG